MNTAESRKPARTQLGAPTCYNKLKPEMILDTTPLHRLHRDIFQAMHVRVKSLGKTIAVLPQICCLPTIDWKSPVRAGSVAVDGHALDWPRGLECADCVGMRWKAPIAPFAPNCADCAVCAELSRLRWNCAGILPTAWHTANTTLWLSQPGCDLGFAVVPGFCGSLPQSCDFSSTFSQRDKQFRSKT